MEEASTVATARATSTDSPRLLRTLRWHFTDVAATYAHPNFLKPWQHRHSLWWWLQHIYACSKKLADRRVCRLSELVRAIHHHHQAPIHDFVKERTLTDKWRDRISEGQLALADFILHLLWKYCSAQGPMRNSSSAFPLFTLVCDQPSHSVFGYTTYHGLDESGHVRDWTLEWTSNGYLGVEYWSKHSEELRNKGTLETCLVPERARAGEHERPEPSVKLSPVSSDAEEEDEDEAAAVPVRPWHGRPRTESLPVGQSHDARPDKRRRLVDTSEHRRSAETRSHVPAATTTTTTPTTTASASGPDEEERVDALLLLLAAKERKIEVRRQLLFAEQTVRRARARLHRAGGQEDHH